MIRPLGSADQRPVWLGNSRKGGNSFIEGPTSLRGRSIEL